VDLAELTKGDDLFVTHNDLCVRSHVCVNKATINVAHPGVKKKKTPIN